MEDYSVFRCEVLPELTRKINPNFIYNRFDLWELHSSEMEVSLWCYKDQENEIYFETLVSGLEAKLGLWLVFLNRRILARIIKKIFITFPSINKIIIDNALAPAFAQYISRNHFHIELPETEAELEQRLSSKGRYNIRREKRILREKLGGYKINHYHSLALEAEDAWSFYFEMKRKTYGNVYGIGIVEYCRKYHVSDVYTLTVGDNNRLASVFLSCEQCPIVYLENLTYDLELAEYSPGQILYDEYLRRLIAEKAQGVFLLGGDYSYKKRYGSIENRIYNCIVYRSQYINSIKWAKRKVRNLGHIMKEKLRSWNGHGQAT